MKTKAQQIMEILDASMLRHDNHMIAMLLWKDPKLDAKNTQRVNAECARIKALSTQPGRKRA